jgi:cold shock CspA family protein
MDNARLIGIVTAYRRAGYGWLDWNGNRVWIHIRDVRDPLGHLLPALKVGQQIQFDVLDAPKGLRACNARLVVDAPRTTEVKSNESAQQV